MNNYRRIYCSGTVILQWPNCILTLFGNYSEGSSNSTFTVFERYVNSSFTDFFCHLLLIAVQVLKKYCPNTVKILFKYCSNTVSIL